MAHPLAGGRDRGAQGGDVAQVAEEEARAGAPRDLLAGGAQPATA